MKTIATWKRLLPSLVLIFSLSACGTLVGAGAGGLAGNQFGEGSGKTAATIGGVAAGGLIGHAVTGD
jgi:osmotically inducible lipoprotein OsmB